MLLNQGQCRIDYLYNSGFAIETKNCFIVIDCYKESPHVSTNRFSHKNNYVFVTHNHQDHFNSMIFDWSKKHHIQYIIDKDVPSYSVFNRLFVIPDQRYPLDHMVIETLGSTDRGVSYLISVDGLFIFHSGDLNWWKWKDKSQEIHQQEEADFKREIHKLLNKKIDIAFVPVDPRLEEYYDLAVKYLAETIDVKVIIPMHFRDSLKPIQLLAQKWQDYNFSSQFLEISRENQSFYFDGNLAVEL